MSVLEWAWLVTFALIVAVYLIHFARAVLPDFLQTILSYGNKRKNGSVFADVPKRYYLSSESRLRGLHILVEASCHGVAAGKFGK